MEGGEALPSVPPVFTSMIKNQVIHCITADKNVLNIKAHKRLSTVTTQVSRVAYVKKEVLDRFQF